MDFKIAEGTRTGVVSVDGRKDTAVQDKMIRLRTKQPRKANSLDQVLGDLEGFVYPLQRGLRAVVKRQRQDELAPIRRRLTRDLTDEQARKAAIARGDLRTAARIEQRLEARRNGVDI